MTLVSPNEVCSISESAAEQLHPFTGSKAYKNGTVCFHAVDARQRQRRWKSPQVSVRPSAEQNSARQLKTSWQVPIGKADAARERSKRSYALSTSGITSSLLSQIVGSPSTANQFATDLNQLAQDLQSGNLSAAQQDYITLSEDALDGATSSTATTSASGITTGLLSEIASSSSSSSAFVGALTQLGTDLQNGNLTSAQEDLLTLDSTALNAASSAGVNSSATTSATNSATLASQTESSELIQAIVQAIGAGDNTVASSALSALASISPSSAGASVLQQESANFGSSTGATSSSSSISDLLQSLNPSSSTLNLLA